MTKLTRKVLTVISLQKGANDHGNYKMTAPNTNSLLAQKVFGKIRTWVMILIGMNEDWLWTLLYMVNITSDLELAHMKW